MSVIPLPVRLPDGGKPHGKPRDVPGTVNIPYGHRLSQHGETRRNVNAALANQSHRSTPGKSIRAKEHQWQKQDAQRISILPGDTKSADLESNAKDEREYNSIVRTYDFVERTNKRILGRTIRGLVDEGMAAYERDIAARREKLRSMILSEEADLAREMIDQARRGVDGGTERARERTREVRERLEKERLATVASKRMQQYLAECPEARARLGEKRTREIKYSNLVQIAEKEAKRRAEREVDGLWYGLMLKELEAKKAREMEEEKRRAAAGKEVVVTLEKQIAGKLALSEEEKRLELEEREYPKGLWESVEREELANLERERAKRAEVKKDLEEQLRVAKRCLAERARKEADVERMFRELDEAELARERTAIKESSSRLRNEIVAYMTSLRELAEEEARREAEVEAIVEASARQVEMKRDLAERKTRELRARNLRELLEGREQQLRAKRIAHEEENKRAELEGELRRKESEAEAALAAQAEARRRENAIRYGQELKAQRKYAEIMSQREREENERMLRLEREREQEYQKFAERQLPNAPEIITPRAFKMLLKECAALRDDEQKGLCCHPPGDP